MSHSFGSNPEVHTPTLLVVGSMNMDLVLEAERIPLPGESYFGSDYHSIPGGKGANQAAAAARMGARVLFSGRVGNDPNGTRLRESLGAEGINVSRVAVDAIRPTGLAVIIVEPDGSNRILVYAGANMEIDPASIAPLFDEEFDAVLINLEIPDEVISAICNVARARKVPVVVDAGPPREFSLASIVGSVIVSPNETEAQAMCGIECDTEQGARDAARRIHSDCGCRFSVIKLGKRGCIAFDGDSFFRQETYPVPVVDTTAAGDSFTAALVVTYLTTGDIEESLRWANAAGSVTVSRLGAMPSLATRAECAALLEREGETKR